MAEYIPPLRFHALTPLYDLAVRWTTSERRFRTAMLDAMAVSRHAVDLLDIGCGTGSHAIMLKQMLPAARIVGMDADERALDLARRKAAAVGVAITFQRGDARLTPFADASFDAVSASLFFHHLEDSSKLAVLRELHRCLKPGGKLVVADWDRPRSLWGRVRFGLVRGLDGFAVTRAHASGGFPALLRAAGYEVAAGPVISAPLGSIAVWSCAPRKSEIGAKGVQA